jgi:uncharacterized membrane protein YGL010W
MKTLVEQLSSYATYHRDPRNIVTHFIGIPMIIVAIAILLSRPHIVLGDLSLSPVLFLIVFSSAYYLRLSLSLGLVMSALLGGCWMIGRTLAAETTMLWLSSGLGLFVIGWGFQFAGHYYEGKKPAFVDDISGFIIGPLFVVAEFLFMLGLFRGLQGEIERVAGPVAVQTKKDGCQTEDYRETS